MTFLAIVTGYFLLATIVVLLFSPWFASVASNSSAAGAPTSLPAPAASDLCLSHARTTLRTAAANSIHEPSSASQVTGA